MTSYLAAVVAATITLVILALAARRSRRWRAPTGAALEPVGGGEPVPLRRRRLAVGRHHADLLIREPTISALHAELVHADGHWNVHDHRSRNGTFVNDERVTGQRTLRDGDRIRFAADGPTYVFRSGSAPTQRGRSA